MMDMQLTNSPLWFSLRPQSNTYLLMTYNGFLLSWIDIDDPKEANIYLYIVKKSSLFESPNKYVLKIDR